MRGRAGRLEGCRYEDVRSSDIPEPPFASDKLREVGLDALPALIEILDDRTPTRTVGYWRDFHPSRFLLTVGSAAREIFAAVAQNMA